jgi:hypothetical protein
MFRMYCDGLGAAPKFYRSVSGGHMDTSELVSARNERSESTLHEMLSTTFLSGAGRTAYRKLIEQLVLEHALANKPAASVLAQES